MDLVARLCATPGVLAAGEYAYHGDQFTYEGDLDAEQARRASVMCRATTMAIRMQGRMLDTVCPGEPPLSPVNAWAVRGPRTTVCVVANIFCFIDNEAASANAVLRLMREALNREPEQLIY